MPKKLSKDKTAKSHKVLLSKDFYSDITKANMLYAVLVRSSQTNINITNIDLSRLPSGYFFFTSRDIPGKNVIHTLDTTTTVFCEKNVNFEGEPIGILTGSNREELLKLAEELSKSFEVPELNDEEIKTDETESDEASSSPREILASREVKTGLFADKEFKKEEIFSDDYLIVESQWNQSDLFPDWNETSGAFCYMDGSSLVVLSPTKWPSHLKQSLCDVLGLSEEQIILKKTQIQKSNFNGTWRNSTITVQAALASYLTGKPVKLILSREEQNRYIDSQIGLKISHKSAVKNNRIISMEINISADMGYNNPFSQEFIDRIILSSISIYNPENLYIRGEAFRSQKYPTSVYPELIDSTGYGSIESHMNKIASMTSCLPDEIRAINSQNKKTPRYSPFNYEISDQLDLLEPIIKQSGFNRKYSAYNHDSEYLIMNNLNAFHGVTRKGIGLSFAIDGSGYYGSSIFNSSQTMETTLELDGTLSIHTPVQNNVISEIWKKLTSEMLQIKPENVVITNEFPDDEIPDLPENVYNNISVMTHLLKKCCQEIQKKRFLNPLPIHSSKSITSSMKKYWNKIDFKGIPFHSESFGSAIVELELNPDTYSIQIKGIWIIIDCGTIMDIKAAECTIKQSIMKELKNLITDDTLYCENIHINFMQSNNDPGQIDGIIHSLIPSAFINALEQTLCIKIEEIPCSRNKLFELTIENKNKKLEELKNKKEKESELKNEEQISDIEQSINEMQKPLQDIINEIEENKQDQEVMTQEEIQEKAEEKAKADDEAIAELMEQESKKQNNLEDEE